MKFRFGDDTVRWEFRRDSGTRAGNPPSRMMTLTQLGRCKYHLNVGEANAGLNHDRKTILQLQ